MVILFVLVLMVWSASVDRFHHLDKTIHRKTIEPTGAYSTSLVYGKIDWMKDSHIPNYRYYLLGFLAFNDAQRIGKLSIL